MTNEEAVKALNALTDGDTEIAHIDADTILLSVLDVTAPRVVRAYREAQQRIGFWYA